MAEIEYFYSAHSAYAYLGSARLMALAAAGGAHIVHRPVDLRLVVARSGAPPFAQRTRAHIDYFFRREIERWAEYRGIKVMAGIPTHHANDITLPNGLLIAALMLGRSIDRLAHALLEAHWVDDADLADRATLVRLAEQQGFNGQALAAAALSEPVQAVYRANTEQAIARNVFGSPTYFVAGDMFYGQDRLEMLARALANPFAGRFEVAATG